MVFVWLLRESRLGISSLSRGKDRIVFRYYARFLAEITLLAVETSIINEFQRSFFLDRVISQMY